VPQPPTRPAPGLEVRHHAIGWGSASRAWLRREGPFAAILVLAVTLLTLNVATPFWAVYEDNGAVFTGVAANHLRLGLDQTKGQDVFALTPWGLVPPAGEVDVMALYFHGETTPSPYGHHPPLLGLTLAGAVAVFGEHLAVVRAVPIVYSLLSLLLFYALMVRLFDRGVARLAALLFVTFPLFAFFGRNVAHEAPTLCFGLALVASYVRWRSASPSSRRWWAVAMVASIVLGGGYGWPIFYLTALLFGLDWLSRRRFDWRLLGLLGLAAGATLAAVVAQIAWLHGGLSELENAFRYRRDLAGDAGVAEWIDRLVRYYAGHNFGRAIVVLLPLAVVFVGYRIVRERFSQRTMVVTLLGAWGLSHVLLFLHGAWWHMYWQFYLLPFAAIAVAWPAVELARRYLRPAAVRAAAFLVVAAAVYAMQHPTIIQLYSHATALDRVVPVRTLWATLLD
jgi:4-amino-4-deoxy-L-arabinose transferase-like glycosyltransferase